MMSVIQKNVKAVIYTITALFMCSGMALALPFNDCNTKTNSETQRLCDCNKADCAKPCTQAPVFNSCEEIQAWKIKFFEKRACLYEKLCLTQEQRVKAKCVDEKFFDEIAPLKMCCKQEKAKLEEMKCKKCSWSAKHEQKQKIKDLKSEIKDKKHQHEESFTEILSCEQKDKYKQLKKDKCKKHKKPKCECGCK